MLKIIEENKPIELNGERFDLSIPSAKEVVTFSVKIEKEKDQSKQIDMMISYVSSLGIPKAKAIKISIDGLKKIIEYVGNNEKK